MNGNLMDTNVIVRVLNGDRELVKKLSALNGLCSCTVVLGELFYGAAKSQRTEYNKQNAKAFCSRKNSAEDEWIFETRDSITPKYPVKTLW